jgi:two-component system, NtrC family, sensor kinase
MNATLDNRLADLERQLAEREAELAEAREQQTATVEVLQVINSSPGELAPVFEAILEQATRLCNAAFGMVWTYDRTARRYRPGVMHRAPAVLAEFLSGDYRAARSDILNVLGGASFLHILDAAESEGYRTGANLQHRAMVDLGGVRTVLAVPLRQHDTVLAIYRQEVRAFSDKQIVLLQNFAAQAVIAMENARLLIETREALEQQTATAEVLGVINSSPVDLGPVFDAMLTKAVGLCEADQGVLRSFDGESFPLVAIRGRDPSIVEQVRQLGSIRIFGLLNPMVHGERVVHIPDVRKTATYRDYQSARDRFELAGTRTWLGVALRKEDTLLGAIIMFRREMRPFSDKQIALVKNFAAQAVIAMENARLMTEQREALEQQTATTEVLQVINASPGNLTPVFEILLEKAIHLCEAAFGMLHIRDGENYRPAAQRNVPSAYVESKAMAQVTTAPTLTAKHIVHVLDVRELENYQSGDEVARAFVELAGARTHLAVPLVKDDVVLGVISIFRQEVHAFSNKQIALLENFAAQAVIAMENARLLEEVRQRQEELHVTFENMGDGVAMFDETQYLVAWNRKFQEILDVPDDLLKQNRTYEEHLLFLAARGDFGPGVTTVEQITELVASTGQPYGYERTRPDGRVIETRRNPVPDGGFVLIYSDITERKQNEIEIRAARDAAEEASRTIEAAYRELKTAQANLIQAEKMASLGQLTAGIAHEIKNPLNFVNNFAALSVDLLGELKEAAAPGFAALTEVQRAEIDDVSAMLTSNLEKITEHGKRADGIVKAMLEHSRGSSGERRLVDLNALVDDAVNLAYHGARAQDQTFNITLERDFDEGIAPIEVNPQDITRVFLNIFSNGFYAATRRAREGRDAAFVPMLNVTTIDAGEAVEIRVRDNGTGIPADIRDKLFQPFFTTKPTGEGTGLGLSITYDIVTQQHGGSIAVDSKVGDYSEFTIRLPRNP